MSEFGGKADVQQIRIIALVMITVTEFGQLRSFPGFRWTSELQQLLPFMPSNSYSHFRPTPLLHGHWPERPPREADVLIKRDINPLQPGL
jgi:hypothetical protein